ncbi:FAD:protein FMN transferase [bacterium]|nr:FAD:protein FMN transferase [candidate division CSSED10-310 bacterium]
MTLRFSFSSPGIRFRGIPPIVWIALSILCLVPHPGCTAPTHREVFSAMGGIPVKIVGKGFSSGQMQAAAAAARASIEQWENDLSFYHENSLINRMRKSPGQAVPVPEDIWRTLVYARDAFQISDGAFDITVGPLIALWKQAEKEQKPPDAETVRAVKAGIGFNRLRLDPAAKTVELTAAGGDDAGWSETRIDIGGIAKGMFAEWIVQNIDRGLNPKQRVKAEKLIVDVGGDIYCRSYRPGSECIIGIQNPFGEGLWGSLEVDRGAVVTSGVYERFFEIQGNRYCHIVDPRTGYPIETDLVSVTILDPSGAMADALATAVFVLGEDRGWEIVNSRPETEMVLIRSDGSSRVTPGIRANLDVFHVPASPVLGS